MAVVEPLCWCGIRGCEKPEHTAVAANVWSSGRSSKRRRRKR